MTNHDRLERVRGVYEAFASGDRSLIEASFSDDFSFSSPLDVGLDRRGYFERCWPGSGRGQKFEFARLIEFGDEVIVTYEMTKPEVYQSFMSLGFTVSLAALCPTVIIPPTRLDYSLTTVRYYW